MARDQEIKFKPYVGLFFKFCVEQPSIAKKVYGNELKNKVDLTLEELPDTILVVDEKRNYVRFISDDGTTFWTRKTHIEPVPLPTHKGSPVPVLQKTREFLVYCTSTRIKDFRTEVMSDKATELLPEIDALIEKFKLKIIPEE